MSTPSTVRLWLGLALVAVLVEQAVNQYATGSLGPHLFWGGLSLLLLYLVLQGRDLARIAFLALAVLGVVAYVWRVDEVQAIVLTLAYGAQAATMLVPAVRGWTKAAEAERRATENDEA